MTVREVIEEYKKLDLDRNIWVEYDGFRLFPPIPDARMSKRDAETYVKLDGIDTSEGDYVITAG